MSEINDKSVLSEKLPGGVRWLILKLIFGNITIDHFIKTIINIKYIFAK